MGLARSKKSATGRAQLLDEHSIKALSDTYAIPGMEMRTASRHAVFRVRVTPDDRQPEFDSSLSIWGMDTVGRLESVLRTGSSTYVTYDPRAADQCKLDLDRLEKEFGRAPNGKQRLAIPGTTPRGGLQPAGSAPQPSARAADTSDTVSNLAKLAEMRRTGLLTDDEFVMAKARLLGL